MTWSGGSPASASYRSGKQPLVTGCAPPAIVGGVKVTAIACPFADTAPSEFAELSTVGAPQAVPLQVRIPSDKKNNDDEIAKRALAVLAWNSSVPPSAVHVKVQSGLITLLGQVDWNYQRESAEETIRKLSGVAGPDLAAGVLSGVDTGLPAREQALARQQQALLRADRSRRRQRPRAWARRQAGVCVPRTP